LGFGDNKDVEAPKELTLPTAVAAAAAEDAADLKTSVPPLAVSGIVVHVWHAAAGASHSLVATDQGVYVWGKGAHGVLGTGEYADATSPLLLESFKERGFVPTRVFAGGSHSMALCRKVPT
jgi:alpha-tubulin suppressor-like RCC1 family protein